MWSRIKCWLGFHKYVGVDTFGSQQCERCKHIDFGEPQP